MNIAYVTVLAKPRAKSPGVSMQGDRLVIRIAEPAEQGKANEACRKALAAALHAPLSAVVLVRGPRSKLKRFAISGMSDAALVARLAALRDSTTRRAGE